MSRGTTNYFYDADGTLAAQTTSGSTISYTQDLAAPLSQVLQVTDGVTTTDYLYGVERLAAVQGGTRTWYGGDGLGSVRQTLSDAGTSLGSVNYDPWGTPESGTVPTFGFTGELQDTATELVNLRARWYSTGKGTFITKDPFEANDAVPQSLHAYTYAHNDPINFLDPSGEYRCRSAGVPMAGRGGRAPFYTYYDLCQDSYAVADLMVNSAGTDHPLGVLISLFSAGIFPGGSSPKALKLRRQNHTAAAERLEFILDYTSDPTGNPFGKEFRDKDFNEQFRDPWGESSWNQVAHFLTAAGFGYDAATYVSGFRKAANVFAVVNRLVGFTDPSTLSDEEVALRLITGHEKVGDSSSIRLIKPASTVLSHVVQQYGVSTNNDVELFLLASLSDSKGDYSDRDCLLRDIIPGFPDNPNPADYPDRTGNSLQDLRLSVKGWRFGKMIKEKRITSLMEASSWIDQNLR
jgi:RHS repeat-associated protein